MASKSQPVYNKIEQDHSRFQEIIRGRIRKNLRKYITRGEMTGKRGQDLVSIPVPHIQIPTLRFGDNSGVPSENSIRRDS